MQLERSVGKCNSNFYQIPACIVMNHYVVLRSVDLGSPL